MLKDTAERRDIGVRVQTKVGGSSISRGIKNKTALKFFTRYENINRKIV